MLTPEKKALVCEQCGQPMGSDATLTGCLNCLLLGGLDPNPAADTLPPASAPPSPPVPAPGRQPEPRTRTYQHYEICTRPDGSLWELGHGAMGVTYKALDVNLRVPVALKVIGTRYSAHPEARARFLREARATARLHHPNVASVHHFGTITHPPGEGGTATGELTEYFYAMEFIEGETLEARVRRAGVLRPIPALEIALQVAHALAAAERRGMVHRDVKPANIMFTEEGEAALETGMSGDDGEAWVKIIDFGLAKAIKGALAAAEEGADDNEIAGVPITHGGFLGTPQFASPEQFAGGDVDVRSDIFSLGVTLWYMVCGELPYEGNSLAEVRDRQLHRELPTAQLEEMGTPKTLVKLLRAMLAPDPQRRPSSARALCERLRRSLTTVREGGLIGQLKTRRVYRVVLGYAMGAWIALQLCASGLRGLGAPVWAPHVILVLLAAGAGAAALGGWAIDRRAIGKSGLPRRTARRVAFVAAAMLPSLLVAEYFHLTRSPAPPPAAAPAASSPR